MEYLNYFNNTITVISFVVNIMLIIPCIFKIYEYFTRKRYAKKVLGYSKEAVQVSQCTFELNMLSGSKNTFITYASVISTNNVISLFNIVGQKFCLVENPIDARNEINIGGFSANKKVNAYFVKYFNNFKFLDTKNKEEAYQKHGVDMKMFEFNEQGKKGFRIDDTFYDITSKVSDYAFLIKLTNSDFKNSNEKTVHIVFGIGDVGTIKATEYLLTHYKQIYEMFGEEHYFFALEVNKVDNSINYARGIIDFTDRMFK